MHDKIANELRENLSKKNLAYYIKDIHKSKKENVITIKFNLHVEEDNFQDYLKLKLIIRELANIRCWYIFDFKNCMLKSAGVRELIKEIIANKIPILELDLSDNNITVGVHANISSAAPCTDSICDLIRKTEIQSLTLSSNRSKPFSGDFNMIQAILSSTNLLYINGCDFDLKATEIKQHLESNGRLFDQKILQQRKEEEDKTIAELKNAIDELEIKQIKSNVFDLLFDDEDENETNTTTPSIEEDNNNRNPLSTVEKLKASLKDLIECVEEKDNLIEIKFTDNVKDNEAFIVKDLSKYSNKFSLIFNQCDLDDKSAEKLINGLNESNINLVKLDLNDNDLTYKSMHSVCTLIKGPHIEELGVRNTSIKEDDSYSSYVSSGSSYDAIVRALKKNTRIYKLDLKGHNLGEKTHDIIETYLERNRLTKELNNTQSQLTDLVNENKDLKKELQSVNNKLSDLSAKYEKVLNETQKLKGKLYNEKDITFAQKMVRGFQARHKYKALLAIKQGIQKAVSENNYGLVAELSKLWKENKLKEAMDVLHSQEQNNTLANKVTLGKKNS